MVLYLVGLPQNLSLKSADFPIAWVATKLTGTAVASVRPQRRFLCLFACPHPLLTHTCTARTPVVSVSEPLRLGFTIAITPGIARFLGYAEKKNATTEPAAKPDADAAEPGAQPADSSADKKP